VLDLYHSKQFLYTELLYYVNSYLMSAAVETTIRLRHGLSKCQQPPGWKIDGKSAISADRLLDTRCFSFSCRRTSRRNSPLEFRTATKPTLRVIYRDRYIADENSRVVISSPIATWTRAFAPRGWV